MECWAIELFMGNVWNGGIYENKQCSGCSIVLFVPKTWETTERRYKISLLTSSICSSRNSSWHSSSSQSASAMRPEWRLFFYGRNNPASPPPPSSLHLSPPLLVFVLVAFIGQSNWLFDWVMARWQWTHGGSSLKERYTSKGRDEDNWFYGCLLSVLGLEESKCIASRLFSVVGWLLGVVIAGSLDLR